MVDPTGHYGISTHRLRMTDGGGGVKKKTAPWWEKFLRNIDSSLDLVSFGGISELAESYGEFIKDNSEMILPELEEQEDGSLYGSAEKGNWFREDTITGNFHQDQYRIQGDSNKTNAGSFSKRSLANFTSRFGYSTDTWSLAIKKVHDGGTATTFAGLRVSPDFKFGAETGAALFSERLTIDGSIHDWRYEIGFQGKAFSLGIDSYVSYSASEGFKCEQGFSGLFGGKFIFRIVPPQ